MIFQLAYFSFFRFLLIFKKNRELDLTISLTEENIIKEERFVVIDLMKEKNLFVDCLEWFGFSLSSVPQLFHNSNEKMEMQNKNV